MRSYIRLADNRSARIKAIRKRIFLAYPFILALSIILNITALVKISSVTNKISEIEEMSDIAQQVSQQALSKTMEEEWCSSELGYYYPYEYFNPIKMTVTATAYCPCAECCGVWSAEHPSRAGTDYVQLTSSGTVPTEGRTIATDPDVIPTGSRVLIDGKEYVAEDVGGAIEGNRIDIFFDSHEEALEWGVRTIEVTVFEE